MAWLGQTPQQTQSPCTGAQPTHTGTTCVCAFGKPKKLRKNTCMHDLLQTATTANAFTSTHATMCLVNAGHAYSRISTYLNGEGYEAPDVLPM